MDSRDFPTPIHFTEETEAVKVVWVIPGGTTAKRQNCCAMIRENGMFRISEQLQEVQSGFCHALKKKKDQNTIKE